ncbi:MAG: T9SS type B sorting domain-containing protein [Flavisolibacter sp.]
MRKYSFAYSIIILLSFFIHFKASTQGCPPNIDFETGTFAGWTCYIGSVAAVGGQNVISLNANGPSPDRQTMFVNPGAGLDPYGGFPINCPNGSGRSIKLGNDAGGGLAEGISYEFTIPAGQNEYSLIYHYAVVFQDPNHQQFEQPRMEIEITNVSDNKIIDCSSFTFFPNGSLLPGFFVSPMSNGDAPVWCKDWSAVSINLNGNAGKTIRLFFKTADCTFRRHFGYAYIDVNSECSSEFVGAKFCKDDTAVIVTAPFGYQNYTWFNNDFTQTIGKDQTIRFEPPPPIGTTIAVEVIPFNGYGCLDTLYARLVDNLIIRANAGRDTMYCGRDPVPIGINPIQGMVYSWSPTIGLSSSTIANPVANPPNTTTYVLTTRHHGGGCVDIDSVVVTSEGMDPSIQLIGKDMYCMGNNDSAILRVNATDSLQWYRDGAAINGANRTDFRVSQSGTYNCVLYNSYGCSISTEERKIIIDNARPGITYPVQYAVIDIPITLQARQFGTNVIWMPSANLNNANILRPVFTGGFEQLYKIQITTASGCVTVDTQVVKTVKHADIYVPTAFTPNSDRLNDYLRPTLMGIKELRYFRVFNRWGQLLYEMNTENMGWDGSLNGLKQPTQIVVWMAEAIGVDGRVHIRKGTTTLVR